MLEVRLATTQDVSGIYTVSSSSLKRDSWTEDMYRREFMDSTKRYFVAYSTLDPEIILGFVGYAQVFDEAHIMNLAVDEKSRRKGIASLLVNALIKDAKNRGVESATLEVRESNNGARALYNKLGFREVGVRPDYYPDREGAVILWYYF